MIHHKKGKPIRKSITATGYGRIEKKAESSTKNYSLPNN